jgi:hypothetical protein
LSTQIGWGRLGHRFSTAVDVGLERRAGAPSVHMKPHRRFERRREPNTALWFAKCPACLSSTLEATGNGVGFLSRRGGNRSRTYGSVPNENPPLRVGHNQSGIAGSIASWFDYAHHDSPTRLHHGVGFLFRRRRSGTRPTTLPQPRRVSIRSPFTKLSVGPRLNEEPFRGPTYGERN